VKVANSQKSLLTTDVNKGFNAIVLIIDLGDLKVSPKWSKRKHKKKICFQITEKEKGLYSFPL